MRLIKTKDYAEASAVAAEIMAAQIILKPDSVIGLATGSTPCGMYANLVKKYQNGLDFSAVTTVNLDEYVGLPEEHEQSYRKFMNDNLFNHVNIKPENTHLPNGMAADPEAECVAYEQLINSLGGIDMQLLGIGHNGHIGFNEPSDHFVCDTNCITLTARTIEANSRFFDSPDDVPRRALSMGIRTILRAKRILLLITSEEKAEILKKAVYGPVTPQVPASILQLHPDVTVVADAGALSAL
ncbi:MAG: glucosamine-6-phosphate deaminase [Ruminococcaceae bacterium]|nr:glucosamine-6-phosphate deaminase [Oscillospiraceae bacterium]